MTSAARGSACRALAAALLLGFCLARARASAIPMWEFLTREEKMSHLFRLFSQEVAQYCAESSKPDCNKNLLVTGLKNLAQIEEDRLDEMDPYQRGAQDIIWRAMLGSGRQPASRLGQQLFHTTDADPLAVGDNDLAQESAPNADYAQPSDHPGPYLMGPMVIRVYPDGRPVPNEAQPPLPRDEDIEGIRLDTRLPSIKELEVVREPSRDLLPPKPGSGPGPSPKRFGPQRPHPRAPWPANLLVRERFY